MSRKASGCFKLDPEVNTTSTGEYMSIKLLIKAIRERSNSWKGQLSNYTKAYHH